MADKYSYKSIGDAIIVCPEQWAEIKSIEIKIGVLQQVQ